MIRGLIFDIDGTLLDSNAAHAKAWKVALGDAGYPITFGEAERMIGMGAELILDRAAGVSPRSFSGRKILRHKDDIYTKSFFPDLAAFPDARTLVQTLRNRGFALAVATSSARGDMDRALVKLGLEDTFHVRVSAEDVARGKPSSDLLSVALARMELRPSEALMIGDTPYDLEAAQRIGVGTIAFRTGETWNEWDLGDAWSIYEGPGAFLERLDDSPLFYDIGYRWAS